MMQVGPEIVTLSRTTESFYPEVFKKNKKCLGTVKANTVTKNSERLVGEYCQAKHPPVQSNFSSFSPLKQML